MTPKTTTNSNLMRTALDVVEKRRIGVVESHQCERRLNRVLASELRTCGKRSFETCRRADDADVRQNALAVVGETSLTVYDVTPPVGDAPLRHKALVESPLPAVRRFGNCDASLPCVRWSHEGGILTTSGTTSDSNSVRVFDAATMQVVETIWCQVYGSAGVFTHEHSPLDPALVGIGTTSSQMLIADLRAGHVATTGSPRHTNSILGIGWSLSDGNQLATASAAETLVWDRRYLSKSASVLLPRRPSSSNVLPQLSYLDARRLVVMTRPDSVVTYDAYTGDVVHSVDDVRFRGLRRVNRFKFALNRDANVVYYAVKRNVRAYDLNRRQAVMDARGSHIYFVGMLIFNDHHKELYTLNSEQEAIIWSPFR